MSNDTSDYNLKVIHELLLAAFTAEDLRRFCLEDRRFRPICDRFGPNHGFDNMVDEVVEYCRTHSLWPEFLAAVQQARPETYARFERRLGMVAPSAYTPPSPPDPDQLPDPGPLPPGYRLPFDRNALPDTLREWLLSGFNPVTLRRLLRDSDNPDLQRLWPRFDPRDDIAAMVDRTIAYCKSHGLIDELRHELHASRVPAPDPTLSLPAEARLLLQQKSYDEAIQLLRSAYRASPDDGQIKQLLVEALYQKGVERAFTPGGLAHAQRWFDEALRIDPTNEKIIGFMAEIESRVPKPEPRVPKLLRLPDVLRRRSRAALLKYPLASRLVFFAIVFLAFGVLVTFISGRSSRVAVYVTWIVLTVTAIVGGAIILYYGLVIGSTASTNRIVRPLFSYLLLLQSYSFRFLGNMPWCL